MTPINGEIEVKNLDHLGLVAGIVDELGIVEIINEQVGIAAGEIVNAGLVVKATILNGLGFVSRPLYLFPLLVRVPLRVDRARGRTAF